jgi:hypothetical protein
MAANYPQRTPRLRAPNGAGSVYWTSSAKAMSVHCRWVQGPTGVGSAR